MFGSCRLEGGCTCDNGTAQRALDLPCETIVESAVPTGAIIGISVGAVLILVAVAVYVIFFGGRNVSLAPKEAPLVLMFSDIQDSTTLWADLEDKMDLMIIQHHAIIRKLLRKYKGYEVKVASPNARVLCVFCVYVSA